MLCLVLRGRDLTIRANKQRIFKNYYVVMGLVVLASKPKASEGSEERNTALLDINIGDNCSGLLSSRDQ